MQVKDSAVDQGQSSGLASTPEMSSSTPVWLSPIERNIYTTAMENGNEDKTILYTM